MVASACQERVQQAYICIKNKLGQLTTDHKEQPLFLFYFLVDFLGGLTGWYTTVYNLN